MFICLFIYLFVYLFVYLLLKWYILCGANIQQHCDSVHTSCRFCDCSILLIFYLFVTYVIKYHDYYAVVIFVNESDFIRVRSFEYCASWYFWPDSITRYNKLRCPISEQVNFRVFLLLVFIDSLIFLFFFFFFFLRLIAKFAAHFILILGKRAPIVNLFFHLVLIS